MFFLFFFFNIRKKKCYFFFFFFSSRRRHTRFSRDWSSDECSSDLICSVHRAEIMRLRGSLDEAEREARQMCADARGYTAVAAAAFYELAEIKLRTGDYRGAEAAF